jgi:hypothetical protein
MSCRSVGFGSWPEFRQQRNLLRQVSQPITSRGDPVYDDAANVIETHEHAGDFEEV